MAAGSHGPPVRGDNNVIHGSFANAIGKNNIVHGSFSSTNGASASAARGGGAPAFVSMTAGAVRTTVGVNHGTVVFGDVDLNMVSTDRAPPHGSARTDLPSDGRPLPRILTGRQQGFHSSVLSGGVVQMQVGRSGEGVVVMTSAHPAAPIPTHLGPGRMVKRDATSVYVYADRIRTGPGNVVNGINMGSRYTLAGDSEFSGRLILTGLDAAVVEAIASVTGPRDPAPAATVSDAEDGGAAGAAAAGAEATPSAAPTAQEFHQQRRKRSASRRSRDRVQPDGVAEETQARKRSRTAGDDAGAADAPPKSPQEEE